MASDPTYPFIPIGVLLGAFLLSLVLLTNVVRQTWNLGVFLLTFSTLLLTLVYGVDSIIWAKNADIKLHVWCDIASHIEVFVGFVQPACTLIITRRLSKMVRTRTVLPRTRRERRIDLAIDLVLSLLIPAILTGPFYYSVQPGRFMIQEGQGCTKVITSDGIATIFIAFQAVYPAISVLFYCPRIVYSFYRHSRETNQFLSTNLSTPREVYFRVLAIGLFDVILTLPVGVLCVVITVGGFSSKAPVFFCGWSRIHAKTGIPKYESFSQILSHKLDLLFYYLSPVQSIAMSVAIFALFGMTKDARATYWRVLGVLRVARPHGKIRHTLSDMVFSSREADVSPTAGTITIDAASISHTDAGSSAIYDDEASTPSAVGSVSKN